MGAELEMNAERSSSAPTATEKLELLMASEGVLFDGIEYYSANVVRYCLKDVILLYKSDLMKLENQVNRLTREKEVLFNQLHNPS